MRIFAAVALFSASMVWGVGSTMQKIASTSLPALTVGMFRSILAFVAVLISIPIFDRLCHTGRYFSPIRLRKSFSKDEWIGGAICGVLLTAASGVQQLSFNYGAKAGNVAFITSLYIIFVPLFDLGFFKIKPAKTVWYAIPIALVGFYLLTIYGTGFSPEAADGLVLAAALIFGVHIVMTGRYAANNDPVRVSCVQFLVSAVLSGLIALICGERATAQALADSIPSLLYLGIVSSGIAFTLQTFGQKYSPSAAASFLLSLESVFGVIAAQIFLHETMNASELCGCAVIFCAVILSQLSSRE